MTVKEFQTTLSGDLKAWVESPLGRETMQLLGSIRPNYEYSAEAHLFAENRGAMRGYELCLRNILGLCVPPVATQEVPQTYGVQEVKVEKKD